MQLAFEHNMEVCKKRRLAENWQAERRVFCSAQQQIIKFRLLTYLHRDGIVLDRIAMHQRIDNFSHPYCLCMGSVILSCLAGNKWNVLFYIESNFTPLVICSFNDALCHTVVISLCWSNKTCFCGCSMEGFSVYQPAALRRMLCCDGTLWPLCLPLWPSLALFS